MNTWKKYVASFRCWNSRFYFQYLPITCYIAISFGIYRVGQWNKVPHRMRKPPKLRNLYLKRIRLLCIFVGKPEFRGCILESKPEKHNVVWIAGQAKDPKRCDSPFVWKSIGLEDTPIAHSFWPPGNRNCNASSEFCLRIVNGDTGSYFWDDAPCDQASCSICEFQWSYCVHIAARVEKLQSATGINASLGSFRNMHTGARKWHNFKYFVEIWHFIFKSYKCLLDIWYLNDKIFGIMLVSLISNTMHFGTLFINNLAFCRCGPSNVDLILHQAL